MRQHRKLVSCMGHQFGSDLRCQYISCYTTWAYHQKKPKDCKHGHTRNAMQIHSLLNDIDGQEPTTKWGKPIVRSEASLTTALERIVKKAGGYCIKQENPVGIPDRLIIGPGRTVMVEVKAENGKLSKIQAKLHQDLRRLGVEVVVMTGTQGLIDFTNNEVKKWVKP